VHRTGDHLAEQGVVDRRQLAPVDGQVHPAPRARGALFEDPGRRPADGRAFVGGLGGQCERPDGRPAQARGDDHQEVHQVPAELAGVADRPEVVGVVQQGLDHQLLAVGPVAVDAGLVHPGELGDLLVAEARDPVARDELGGRGEDLRPHPRGAAAGTTRRRPVHGAGHQWPTSCSPLGR
jgi:hypothetical protein